MEYNKTKPLRVVTLCSGYDSQCLALERLKENFPEFDYDLVAWSEWDPESTKPIDEQPAVIAHNALFPQWKDRNLGDMTKIDWEKVPDFDLLFYSTPCQSISQAGLQHGFNEGSGTRSSIIWNVRDALRIKRPKYACLENVPAMVSSKFLPMFKLWEREVASFGYTNFSQILNSKDYGIPQNRDQIFMLSILGEETYFFPEKMQLKIKLKDILEDNVDTKYYLNPNKVFSFVEDNRITIEGYIKQEDDAIDPLPDYLKEWLDNYKEEEQDEDDEEEEDESPFTQTSLDFKEVYEDLQVILSDDIYKEEE